MDPKANFDTDKVENTYSLAHKGRLYKTESASRSKKQKLAKRNNGHWQETGLWCERNFCVVKVCNHVHTVPKL